MKKLKHYIPRLFVVMASLSLMTSCEEAPGITEETPDQLFRPVNLSASAGENEVTLTWSPIKNATYFLEISRDSFEFAIDVQDFSLDEAACTIGDLWNESRYSARVKAVSAVPAIKDSEYKQITFVTK